MKILSQVESYNSQYYNGTHTHMHACTHTQMSSTIFQQVNPFNVVLVKKHIRLGHAGIIDHSI